MVFCPQYINPYGVICALTPHWIMSNNNWKIRRAVQTASIINSSLNTTVEIEENFKEMKHELGFWFSAEDIYDYKRAEEDIMF